MNSPGAEGRPSKRAKTDNETTTEGPAPPKSKPGKHQSAAQKAQSSNQSRGRPTNRQRATISASGIHNGDVGILVTSDKGQEKKCLQELSDFLAEFFDQEDHSRAAAMDEDHKETVTEKEVDIEADISAELDSLRPQGPGTDGASQQLSLVTLDIPCVSFVRFPAKSTVDPVEVVRKICLTASNGDRAGLRSRYIRRLTPVSLMRKTLNEGLATLCSQILPKHFRVESEAEDAGNHRESNLRPSQTPCKFAIRPTIRNNNKINRDGVIRTVADSVASLGKHTVDLKGYDKLILVDVYRNVVGMSVVGSEYETLKRFNLAELQASQFGDDDKDEKV
ncbi:hypothetical protein G647_04294 [Cladophialophora carrionii CBS 160.54]|uniref:THUMP domain-containing protein n=1 Tax=Cladophialophora carrionii CBS 160.54 TaxID=1279043 RepID=V9DDF4_9EURO|nr:uncharacterized protein G647_04294 [Cladophialophora carrionii CBS 160.54]ETI24924.1 hypothetical protein G647_04294 [Cladophialophora carrionii CBS 160.54]